MTAQDDGVTILREREIDLPLRKIAISATAFVILISMGVLAGWLFDVTELKSIAPELVSMKANTAVGLLFLALCSISTSHHASSRIFQNFARLFAGLALAIGVATLTEYLLKVDLGIDQILFLDRGKYPSHFPVGRLAPITALTFILLSVSVLLTVNRRRNFFRTSQFLIFVSFLLSFQALVSYVFGMSYVFGFAFYTQMAVHTAVCFVALCVAQLCRHEPHGLMAILTARTAGGRLAKTLLLAAILVPPSVNWLQLMGQRAGLYDSDFGILLRVMGNVLFFIILIWRNAAVVQSADAKREAYAKELELKNAELQQFARISSHDLKEPLRMVSLYVGRLEKLLGEQSDSEVRTCLRFVKEGAVRMNSLVGDMVSYTNVEGSRDYLDRVDCAKVLDQALSQLQSEIEKSQAIIERGPLPVISGNQNELVQLFYCLLDNAIKFNRGGAPRIYVSAKREEHHWLFSVRDNGIGIAAPYENQIFDIFKRLNNRTKFSGNGMGLSLSKKIIDLHQGKIWVTPDPDGGSNFYFTIPGNLPNT